MKKFFGTGGLIILVLLLSGCSESELTDTVIINNGNPGGLVSMPLIAGNNFNIGEVSVFTEGDFIKVTFKLTDNEWLITETNLAVEPDISGIPQTSSGNPIPGHFPYKTIHQPFVKQFTYSVDVSGLNKVYIAAHAYVTQRYSEKCNTTLSMIESLIPSWHVSVSNTLTKVSSMYNIKLENAGELNGIYKGWCIDNNQKQADFTRGLLLSSYSDEYDLNKVVPDKSNLDLLNYLMNKYYPETSFPVIQAAVWDIMNGSFANPGGGIDLTPAQEEQYHTIVAEVRSRGEGFLPDTDESFVIILDSGDRSRFQNVFFIFKKCNSEFQNEISWAKGFSFPGNTWAKYFGYLIK